LTFIIAETFDDQAFFSYATYLTPKEAIGSLGREFFVPQVPTHELESHSQERLARKDFQRDFVLWREIALYCKIPFELGVKIAVRFPRWPLPK
jgi:hypothetical protein